MDINNSVAIALPLIRKWEGYKQDLKNGTVKAYLDPIGIPTIGYGTTVYRNGLKVKMGDVISYAQAENELEKGVIDRAIRISKYITRNITDEQMASLISLAYNAGEGFVIKSKVLQNINSPFFDVFKTAAILKDTATTANGVRLRGLVLRRKDESALFASGGADGKKKVQTSVNSSSGNNIFDRFRGFIFGY
jgi:lysozyme